MTEMIEIAVLMTVHNRKSTTIKCLEYLYANNLEGYQYQVYLVDDASTDGTADAVQKKFPMVKIIHGNGELYWNRGMIKAWEEAAKDEPDFYLWLNDDTMLFENALSIMVASYKETDGNSIICGSTMALDSDEITYGGRMSHKLVIPNGKLQKIEWINGNCVLVPRIVKEKIGILDPYFRHAKGDWEYGVRALKNGIMVYSATDYVGRCAAHENKVPKYYDANYSLKERLDFLYHPLGASPKETYYYCKKCFRLGRLRAFAYITLTYLKVLFTK